MSWNLILCLWLLRIWFIFLLSLALKYSKKRREIGGRSRTVWRWGQWVKVIRFADRSEFGWSANIYQTIWRLIQRIRRAFFVRRCAERRSKQAASCRKISARGARSSPNSAHSSPVRSASTSGLHLQNQASRIGPCYKLSIHFPMLCPLTFLLCLLLAVLVAMAHCIILHIVVAPCCFYGTVNST